MHKQLTLRNTISTLAAFVFAASNAHSQCTPHWEPVGVPDPIASIRSMIWHTDAEGSALIVAGSFGSVSGTQAINIARISNGVSSPLGDGLLGTVYALASFNDGTGTKLYAGGSFTHSGTTPVSHLAAWNGVSWSTVGGGINGTVRALAVHNDGVENALYVGGDFSLAGNLVVSNIARWDGTSWDSMAGGLTGATASNAVNTLLSDNAEGTYALYAAGRIVRASGAVVKPVVRWDGSGWNSVGTGDFNGDTQGVVNSLAFYDPGTGTTLYRASDTGVKRLNSDSWTSVSSALNVNSLFVLNDSSPRGTLYIGISSAHVSGGELVYFGLQRHDGTTTTTTGLLLNGPCFALNEKTDLNGTKLLVGGTFTTAGGVPSFNLAAYDELDGWQAGEPVMHGGTVSGYANSSDSSPTYVGMLQGSGMYKQFGDTLVPYGLVQFQPFGVALDMEVMNFNGVETVVAGGFFAGTRTRTLAAWQNDSVIDLPPLYNNSMNGSFTTNALCISRSGGQPSLLASGRFKITSDNLNHALLRYSSLGVTEAVPNPYPGLWGGSVVERVTPDGTYYYLVDLFGGTATLPPLYSRNPAGTWTSIPGHLTYQGGHVQSANYAIEWFDDNDGGHLYIAGRFDAIDGQPVQGIARVVGDAFEPLPQGVTGFNPYIHDLCVFDDGTGPALYAAGRFETAGVTASNNIARFKNGQWSEVAGGVTQPNSEENGNPPIYHLRTVSNSTGDWLYAMGNFMVADGQFSPKVARYGRCRPCPADFNNDGTFDFFDYLDFVQAFSSNEPAADFNHDAIIDFFDYLDFVAAFSDGCP